MGELNWIFTAITDTIAWNILPPDLFQARIICPSKHFTSAKIL